MSLNKRDERRICEAIRLLEALADPADQACSLPDDVKRIAAPYLRGWVLPLLEYVRDNEPKQPHE